MNERRSSGPRWALILVLLFALLAYGGISGGAILLGVGWAVLCISAWQRYGGHRARLTWIVGVVLVLGYLATLLVGVRLP